MIAYLTLNVGALVCVPHGSFHRPIATDRSSITIKMDCEEGECGSKVKELLSKINDVCKEFQK